MMMCEEYLSKMRCIRVFMGGSCVVRKDVEHDGAIIPHLMLAHTSHTHPLTEDESRHDDCFSSLRTLNLPLIALHSFSFSFFYQHLYTLAIANPHHRYKISCATIYCIHGNVDATHSIFKGGEDYS